jgi:hypothetical protein
LRIYFGNFSKKIETFSWKIQKKNYPKKIRYFLHVKIPNYFF